MSLGLAKPLSDLAGTAGQRDSRDGGTAGMIKPNSFSKDFLGEVPQEFYGQKRPSRPSRGPGRPGVGDRHAVLGVNLGDFGPVRASVPIFLTVAWHLHILTTRLPGLPGDHLTPLLDSTSHSFN